MSTRSTLSSGLVLTLAATLTVSAQDARGRKYKAPPETSHIEVIVLKDVNQKPVANAAVIFHSIKDGKDEGNLEVKTNSEGKAEIDVIPTGSNVDVQVIADGFATFANTYVVAEPSRSIEIRMIKPRAQISTYIDTRGLPAARPVGVQEPVKPGTAPVIQTPQLTNSTSDPSALAPGAMNYTPPAKPASKPGTPVQTNPPDMHPDNQYPADPAAAPKPSNATPPTSPAPPQL